MMFSKGTTAFLSSQYLCHLVPCLLFTFICVHLFIYADLQVIKWDILLRIKESIKDREASLRQLKFVPLVGSSYRKVSQMESRQELLLWKTFMYPFSQGCLWKDKEKKSSVSLDSSGILDIEAWLLPHVGERHSWIWTTNQDTSDWSQDHLRPSTIVTWVVKAWIQ